MVKSKLDEDQKVASKMTEDLKDQSKVEEESKLEKEEQNNHGDDSKSSIAGKSILRENKKGFLAADTFLRVRVFCYFDLGFDFY